MEVYDGLPSGSGTLLRSATFWSGSWGAFVGGSFTALDVTAGEDYFIGFRNVWRLLRNSATSGTSLSCYGDSISDGTYSSAISSSTDIHPVLQLEGVPEPATLLFLGLGGLVLRRKR